MQLTGFVLLATDNKETKENSSVRRASNHEETKMSERESHRCCQVTATVGR